MLWYACTYFCLILINRKKSGVIWNNPVILFSFKHAEESDLETTLNSVVSILIKSKDLKFFLLIAVSLSL